MSRDTNKSKNMRRSALSFNGGDDTIDDFIDGIVQSESWKDTDEIEYSDIGRIQNVLNQFDEKITQEKILKSDKKVARKRRKKSTTEDSGTGYSEASSSNMHSNIPVPKSKVETKEKVTSTRRASMGIEKTSPRESLQHSTNDTKKAVQKTLESSVREIADNNSIRKTNMKEATIMIDKYVATDDSMTANFEGSFSNIYSDTHVSNSQVKTRKKETSTKRASKAIEKTSPRESLQHSTDGTKKAVRRTSESSVKEIAINESLRKKAIMKEVSTNTIDTTLLTSTPKSPRTKETVKDKKSAEEKRKLKMTDSENKPKKDVTRKKKQSTKTLKKNAKDIEHRQDSENMSNKEKTIMNMEENKLECNKENHNTSKKKVQRQKKQCKNICQESKKQENSKNKLQKSTTSNKSLKSLKNNEENKCRCKNQSKSQRKKECAENNELKQQSVKQLKTIEQEKKEREKNKKTAKAMGKLSRKISGVKKRIECIKYDLENSDSDSSSDYSESSSYSTYSSYSECSSNCNCTACDSTENSTDSTSDSGSDSSSDN